MTLNMYIPYMLCMLLPLTHAGNADLLFSNSDYTNKKLDAIFGYEAINTRATSFHELFHDTLKAMQVHSLSATIQPIHHYNKPSSYDLSNHGNNMRNDATLNDIIYDVNYDVRFECLNDTQKVIQDVRNRQKYALMFVDAQAKMPSGVLQGARQWDGDYYECIEIISDYSNFTKHSFKGQYYTVEIQPFMLGVCVPDSCNSEDVASLLAKATAKFKFEISNVYPSYHTSGLGAGDVVAIVSICLVTMLVILGTAVDYYMMRRAQLGSGPDDVEPAPEDIASDTKQLILPSSITDKQTSNLGRACTILRTFSFYSNTLKLTSMNSEANPLSCLNGIRVISMFWVILGHVSAILIRDTVIKDPLYNAKALYFSFSAQCIVNCSYAVDTFFFMSGLLVVYVAMKTLSNNGRINWFYYFGHRFWRITPMLAFALMFNSTLSIRLISGPFLWVYQCALSDQNCQTYWWTVLLYVNNFIPDGIDVWNTCMFWTWYLANDMQMYVVISPIVVLALHKKAKIGYAISVVLILICLTSRALIANHYDISPNDITQMLYTKPYARMSSYVVGLLTGYALFKTRCTFRINTKLLLIGWAAAVATGLSIVYGLYDYNKHPGVPMSGQLLYITLARTAWCLALSWVVVSCASGHGGWINKFLSWPIFSILARLTYSTYLVHAMIIRGTYGLLAGTLQFSIVILMAFYISSVVLSFGVAYVVSMAFEAPMMRLEKLLLNSRKTIH